MNWIDLRNKLIGMGYDAHHIADDSIKIYQKSAMHLLTFKEAKKLSEYKVAHPIKLNDYRERYGKIYFYFFE
jgi:hypothetical protein